MSVLEVVRPVPLGSVTTFRLVSFIERVVVTLSNWRSALATANALNTLSDEQLDDIGLIRGEIADVANTMVARRY